MKQALSEEFQCWLDELHEGSRNADLVAQFFRRAYGLLRDGGCFGLLATNTIRQGDTRSTGLRPIRKSGGTIYTAVRRRKWPGESAAVVVCVIHVAKGHMPGPYQLDGREVPQITAFLFHAGGDDDPATLETNASKSFQGSIILGMGFTFDDTDTKGIANPIALMHELIAKDPRNSGRILPYIGGEEVNDSPRQHHHRYVIDFEDMSEEQARGWQDLLAILEEHVFPERSQQSRKHLRERWWQHAEVRPALRRAIAPLDRVLAISCGATPHMAFAFLSSRMIFSHALVVIPLDTCAAFCVLQSRVHEVWARFFASSMKDDLRYTPSDCFKTFPLPEGFDTDPRLEEAGREYYEFRAGLMIQNDEGLTKTYNRFHDPEERSNAIGELRRLHDAMDRAVLDAYDWMDIQPVPMFELEWKDEDEEEGARRRRKPWRYRWLEEIRDEILARLLKLNQERAAEEKAEREARRAAE